MSIFIYCFPFHIAQICIRSIFCPANVSDYSYTLANLSELQGEAVPVTSLPLYIMLCLRIPQFIIYSACIRRQFLMAPPLYQFSHMEDSNVITELTGR